MKLKLTALAACMAVSTVQADDLTHGYGIDLYGRSYHHDLPAGELDKLNEANIGFALTSRIETGKHVWTLEAGTFLNSYYDTAFWIGGQYRYKFLKYFEPMLYVRHWETAHDTYPEKAISKYLGFAVPITERVRTTFIVRPAGYIAGIQVDL